jgi:hypothetical protein
MLRGLVLMNPTFGIVPWTNISTGMGGTGPHVDHHAIGFDSVGRLLDGNDGGVWRLNSTAPITWADLNNNLQITTYIGIATHPSDPNILYGGSQDNGTSKFEYPGGPGSPQLLNWNLKVGGDGGYVRVDPLNPQTVYHEFFGISLERSNNGGNTWFPATTGIGGFSNFYAPYVLDPANPSRLLFGSNKVYETLNGAANWTAVGPAFAFPSTIDTVAVAPTRYNTIYASSAGHVYVTFDHNNWVQRDLPVVATVSEIVVSPFNDQIAYAVLNSFSGVAGGHVYTTTNGGLNWTDISNNGTFPDVPTWAIAVDPGGPGTGDDILYAATDNGVLIGTNVGGGVYTWAPFADGLPNVQVHDLELNPYHSYLTAGTYGRGVWQIPITRVTALGPDRFGYTASVYPFEDNEIFGQPTTFVIIPGAGDSSVPVNLGANTFRFYDTPYTGNNQLYVSSHGLITFGAANPEWINTDLTTMGGGRPLTPAIAPLWSDWRKFDTTPMVLGQFDLLNPSGPRLILEWYNVGHYPDNTGLVNFQAILQLNTELNSGCITFNYRNLLYPGTVYTEGRISTVGIRDYGVQGPNRLLVSFNKLHAFVGSGEAIQICAPPAASVAPGKHASRRTAPGGAVEGSVPIAVLLGQVGKVVPGEGPSGVPGTGGGAGLATPSPWPAPPAAPLAPAFLAGSTGLSAPVAPSDQFFTAAGGRDRQPASPRSAADALGLEPFGLKAPVGADGLSENAPLPALTIQ